MIGNCDHNGFHSGVGKMAHELRCIRFVLICDDCGKEMREIHVEDYAPAPNSGDHARSGRRAA